MKDHIIIVTSINLIALCGIDLFDLHSFPLEAAINLIAAIILLYLHGRNSKK